MSGDQINSGNFVLISEARALFQDMLGGNCKPKWAIQKIHTLLEEAQVDASVLDPKGEKSVQDMQQAMKTAQLSYRQMEIEKARYSKRGNGYIPITILQKLDDEHRERTGFDR